MPQYEEKQTVFHIGRYAERGERNCAEYISAGGNAGIGTKTQEAPWKSTQESSRTSTRLTIRLFCVQQLSLVGTAAVVHRSARKVRLVLGNSH